MYHATGLKKGKWTEVEIDLRVVIVQEHGNAAQKECTEDRNHGARQ